MILDWEIIGIKSDDWNEIIKSKSMKKQAMNLSTHVFQQQHNPNKS